MTAKKQAERLVRQHKESHGVVGIFDAQAQAHDAAVGRVSSIALSRLQTEFPRLEFRKRDSVSKEEINMALKGVDARLGQTLYVPGAKIRPDGGIIEVRDDNGVWRVILVTEAKHQGNDIDNIRNGILVGTGNNQDLMVAGNAIERSHKNIREFANLMLMESHFPYVLFLEGSNFLTETIEVSRPDGRTVTLAYNNGALNRIDRLTASNYGMPLNTNLCRNIYVPHKDKMIMLQAASIYTQGDGERWDAVRMLDVMMDIAVTSIRVIASDLFNQLHNGQER